MDILLKTPTKSPPRKKPEKQSWSPWWVVALVMGIAGCFLLYNSSDFLQFDENGEPGLSPERKAKLDQELEELENAEQYALVAMRNGYYQCFHCKGKTAIFLFKGEVWKYGVTRKGEKERYGEWHIDRGLLYMTQYEGPLQECLRREKIQIYHYAILPENLKRDIPLIRPPGNKRDT